MVDQLEVSVLVPSWVSQSCCQRKSPPQPSKAPLEHLLSSGLLTLFQLSPVKVYAKAEPLARTFILICSWVWTLWICWLGHWCYHLVKGCLRFGERRRGGVLAAVGPLACAAQAPVHSPPSMTGDTCDGPAVKDT